MRNIVAFTKQDVSTSAGFLYSRRQSVLEYSVKSRFSGETAWAAGAPRVSCHGLEALDSPACLMRLVPVSQISKHIAMSAVNGMDYMLTWNCTHIANAALRSRIGAICRAQGYEPPVICMPEVLLER